MTLELAGRRYEQPQFAVGKDSLEMQFRGVIDVRSPFAPLPADLGITLLAEYPEAPPIRVHLRQLSHSVAAAADRHSADFLAAPESTDGRSIPRNALRISLIEVGETSIPILTGSSERDFTPTAPGEPASAAADTSPAPVNPPSKTDATAVAIDPAGAAEKRTSDLPTVEPAPAPAPPPPPERPLEIIPKIEPP
jgi:hypothetical protein